MFKAVFAKIPKSVAFLFVLGTISLILFWVPKNRQTSQNTRGKVDAASTTGVPDKSKQYQMPVLEIAFYPTTDGVNIDSSVTGYSDTIADIKAKVQDHVSSFIRDATEASKYHGYKDASAQPSLIYSLFDVKEYDTAIPLGQAVPDGSGYYYPDYMDILQNINICDYVDNKGVRAVMFYGYQYGKIVPAESNMAGPYGNISNSYRLNDMPVCNKTYVLYNPNESRLEPGLYLHGYGHHLEAIYNFIDSATYSGDFEGPWTTYSNDNTVATPYRCGWTHNPPNTSNQYIYWDTHSTWTDCEDWNPKATGQVKFFNCTEWNCDEEQFHLWQMQNQPGMNNSNPETSNWWDFIGDFDAAVSSGEKLYYPAPTPTPTPSPTPPPPGPDSDGDGFGDNWETYVGTNPNLACGVNAWPPDFNNDGVDDVNDANLLTAHYPAKIGDSNYDKRYDLNADGLIGLPDLSLLAKYNGQKCVSPSPTPVPSPSPTPIAGDPSNLSAAVSCSGSSPIVTFSFQDNSNFESGFWLDVSADPFNGPSTTTVTPSVWGVKGIYRSSADSTAVGGTVSFNWGNGVSLENGDVDSKTLGSQLAPASGQTYYWRVKAFNFGQESDHIYPGGNLPGTPVSASCP